MALGSVGAIGSFAVVPDISGLTILGERAIPADHDE
jgi:hypothetical protein